MSGVLNHCLACDVAMVTAQCWHCGTTTSGLNRIYVDLPDTACTQIHRLPEAKPFNVTANSLRLVAALQVEDDLRLRYESRHVSMPLVLAVGPDGSLMRTA